MTRNQLQYWQNRETERSNRAKEAETTRTNRVNEAIKQAQIVTQNRINQQTLAETHRSNIAKEGLTAQSNAIQSQNVANQQQHYLRSDSTSLLQANNSRYVADRNYQASQNALLETTRHNKQVEQQQGFSSVANAVTGLLGVGAKIGGLLK